MVLYPAMYPLSCMFVTQHGRSSFTDVFILIIFSFTFMHCMQYAVYAKHFTQPWECCMSKHFTQPWECCMSKHFTQPWECCMSQRSIAHAECSMLCTVSHGHGNAACLECHCSNCELWHSLSCVFVTQHGRPELY